MYYQNRDFYRVTVFYIRYEDFPVVEQETIELEANSYCIAVENCKFYSVEAFNTRKCLVIDLSVEKFFPENPDRQLSL